MRNQCRFKSCSTKKHRRTCLCLLRNKTITETLCRNCPDMDPGKLDPFDVARLPAETKQLLAKQLPPSFFHFMQEVVFTVPVPPNTPLRVVPLLLELPDRELFSELRKISTLKKGKNELFLRYRGKTAIYFPDLEEVHINHRKYKPSTLQIKSFQTFPPDAPILPSQSK